MGLCATEREVCYSRPPGRSEPNGSAVPTFPAVDIVLESVRCDYPERHQVDPCCVSIGREQRVQLWVLFAAKDSRFAGVAVDLGIQRFRNSFNDALLADRIGPAGPVSVGSLVNVLKTTYPTTTRTLVGADAAFSFSLPLSPPLSFRVNQPVTVRGFGSPASTSSTARPWTRRFASSAQAEMTNGWGGKQYCDR